MRTRVPDAFASLLGHERDTQSCLATVAILMLGEYSSANDIPLCSSMDGQASNRGFDRLAAIRGATRRWPRKHRAARSRPGLRELAQNRKKVLKSCKVKVHPR
jgi:hypothetical protein